jgi:hypothetical protein
MKWNYFVGACFLTSVLVLQAGAPLTAVAAGICVAFILNWKKYRANIIRNPGKTSLRR